jgi:predicted ATPase
MSEKTPMLTDVKIKNLRGVGCVELHLDPKQRVFTLFGANGVGKTKCLEALYQFLLCTNKDFAQKRSFKYKWSLMTDMSTNRGTFGIPNRYINNSNDDFSFKDAFEGNNVIYWHSFPVVFLGANRRADMVGDRHVQKIMGVVADRRKYYFDETHQTFMSGSLNSLGMMGDTRAWFVTRARSGNRHQKDADNREIEIDTVVSMLHDIDSRISSDPKDLKIGGDDRVFLTIEGQERELGELSSGFASLVRMIQAIVAGYAAFTNEVQLQNVRGIVLIDEIDGHLHASWQASIIPRLKKLLPNTTFYIATHSPLVLVQLLQGEAYSLRRHDDGVVRSEIIDYPNRRLFVDVLDDALGVDLNKFKLASMEDDDQSELKQRLLSRIQPQKEGTA